MIWVMIQMQGRFSVSQLQLTSGITKNMFQLIEKVDTLNTNLSMKSPRDGASREYIKQYVLQNYDLYEQLFTLLKNQSTYYLKPQVLRHPLIFYYGHTASFFINKLLDKGIIDHHIDERLQAILAVGVDEMDWDDLDKTEYNWPSVEEVNQYRREVRKKLIDVVDTIDLKISHDSDLWVLLMGVEHEKVHFQTSAAIIRQLPIQEINSSETLIDCPLFISNKQEAPENIMKTVPAYKGKWGRSSMKTTDYFGWDDEFGDHMIDAPEFNASAMLASNGQFLEFVLDNGYSTQKYWDAQGWAWITSTKKQHPVYWVKEEEEYKLRTLNKIMPMPLDWPVEVNNLEASAFCAWKSEKMNKKIRLPTEEEYHALRELLPYDMFDWPQGKIANINLEVWSSPCPVNIFQAHGFYDIIGNVYQHTCTPLYPLKNFEIHPNYEDYSTPTFDCRHYLIKGGAFSTIGDLAFKHARNAFRRHFYQFAGFRYVQSPVQPKIPQVLQHETDEEVSHFIKLHFLSENSYVQQCIRIIKETYTNPEQKFLHVGCSVGMMVLEMSKHFAKSYGTDSSTRYFQMVSKLFEKGEINYRGTKLSTEKICPKGQNVVLYQVNPENPDSNKINNFKFIVVDGFSVKPKTFKRVIRKFLPLMLTDSYLMLVNCPGTNEISSEEALGMVKEGHLLDERLVPVQEQSKQQIRLSLFFIKTP